MKTVELGDLIDYCDTLLDAGGFEDYAPNGLQVDGARAVRRLATGVTASLALIEAASDWGADAILVHHGWFWKGENPCLTGVKGRRAMRLFSAGASLIAYHLPLDAHPRLGNNATLGDQLGFVEARGEDSTHGLLWTGRLTETAEPAALAEMIAERLGRAVTLVDGGRARIERVAWCTGGGQGYLERAAALGADAFISGEISEQTTHLARELGLTFVAAGHHATERGGVRALGEHLSKELGLVHRFIEIDNPA